MITPEKAIQSIEDAYRRKDLESAVALKDFHEEAKQMIQKKGKAFAKDTALINQTAEVLELAYRAEIKNSGFPPIDSSNCSLVNRKNISAIHVKFEEECLFKDGSRSKDNVHVIKSKLGWRLFIPADE